jgi:hypothetical protein
MVRAPRGGEAGTSSYPTSRILLLLVTPNSEKQRYSELAKVKKDESRDAYRAFIESHKPNDIVKANAARRWLRAQGVRGNHLPLVDHRLPKHPITAFFHFMGELREKGDMSGSNVRDMSRAAGEKWRALSDDEKKVRGSHIPIFLEQTSNICSAIPRPCSSLKAEI